ncbi:aldehyde-activating protein [Methylophaga sp. 42_25_T18]|nr:aldehyde-activating protein [Methylophaga sp. 42_25_T18]OUR88029.1 aldehyde-activating protein [Methylophaga sp. 42_8_T64]
MIGKCLCEQIIYEIEGEFGPIFNCHCSKCRRWHGATYRTRGSINKSQFKWLKGVKSLSTYNSSETVTKYFCSNCGSSLISTYAEQPDVIGVPIGGLEGNLGQPQAHIFVDSKATWHEITDNLPQYGSWPDSKKLVRKTT